MKGHMAKMHPIIRSYLPVVDLVIEVTDARAPWSGRNMQLRKLIGQKKHILVLNKADLAQVQTTEAWLKFFKQKDTEVLAVNSQNKGDIRKLQELALSLKPVRPSFERLGLKQPFRVMVVGIPNVGKSTLINRLVGGSRAKTGARPGITRGEQWIKGGRDWELLDTPGILQPSWSNREVLSKLILIDAVDSSELSVEEMVEYLLERLMIKIPGQITDTYGVIESELETILTEIGKQKGALASGGSVDLNKVSTLILKDYRNGKLGYFSLEEPEDALTKGKSDV